MIVLAVTLVLLPPALFLYSYAAYPLLLWVATRVRRVAVVRRDPPVWPMVSLTVPAYNAEQTIGKVLDRLLALDYPAEKRQILVISDGSTDRTDEIVRRYEHRGVELLRQPVRRGKTAAENAAMSHVRGEIVVNVDASVVVPPDSLKPLVRAFGDPGVGVASGRDVSVGDEGVEENGAESGYVGYEMAVRGLETRAGSIVGASGCFYGFRRVVHRAPLPEALSWDFASPLVAREAGFRAVSVDDAVCFVPRTKSLRTEYRRKVRTMARGLDTLWHKRALLDPFRYGSFALMLISHKLTRWLVFLAMPPAVAALLFLAPRSPLAAIALLGVGVAAAAGLVALRWPAGRRVPRLLATAGFAVASLAAGVVAWVESLRGEQLPIWEPTPRPGTRVG